MITVEYTNSSSIEDIFYFTSPGTLDSITGNATAATFSQGGGLVELVVVGTGLAWSGTTPTAGTVESLIFKIDGVTRVTVSGLASGFQTLAFTDLVVPGFGGALNLAPTQQFDNLGDSFAQYMGTGGGDDTLWSNGGNDTLIGNAGFDEITIVERASGAGSPHVVDGGDDQDVVRILDLASAFPEGVNLTRSTFTGVERLELGTNTTTALTAAQTAGLAINFGANAILVVNQTAAQALNLPALFTVAGTIGSGVSLWTNGTTGNDVQVGRLNFRHLMSGEGGHDSLTGANLVDTIRGGLGDDTLIGGGGADRLSGGVGNDTYRIDALDVITENAGEGRDRVVVSFGHTLGTHIENGSLTGAGAVGLTGNGLSNDLRGNGAANRLDGLGGDDTLYGGGGNDALSSGGGNDRVYGGLGSDLVYGGVGSDYLNGEAGNDTIYGGAGQETLNGSDGNDRLYGEAQDDRITGGAGDDLLSGGTGNDVLIGGAGRDRFVFATGEGHDRIEGFVFSGAGSDVIDIRNLTAVTSFADLRANHMFQSGADVVIKTGSDLLVLTGLTVSQLDATDFLI